MLAVLAGLAWCALSPAAAAEPDLGQVVARLPMSVEFVAAIDDGVRLRQELGSSPLMLTLGAMPHPARVIDAWSQLASELGMTDGEAFDLLLGRRLILVGSQVQPDDDGPHWALLTELDPETERRLRADLGAVPRRIVGGQPVLEFEHGSFLMATSNGRLRCGQNGAFDNTPASTILLLAPAADRQLFEQMLPLLRCQRPDSTLGQLPAGEAAAGFEARDAVFLWRLPDPIAAPHRFIAANVGVDRGVWQIDATMGPAAGWIPSFDPTTLKVWSPRLLDTLPPDPALAVVGMRNAVRDAQGWVLPLLAPHLPDPEAHGLEGLLGDRSMFAVWLDPDAPLTADAEVLIATETPDLARLLARADTYLADGAGGSPTGSPGAPPNRSAVHERWTPTAVRSIRLGDTSVGAEGAATLNWLGIPESDALDPQSPDPSQSVTPGWWVVHYEPSGASSTDHAGEPAPRRRAAGVADDSPPQRRYLHIGRARPERWAERAAAFYSVDGAGSHGHVGAPTLLSASLVFSQVRSLEWAVWYQEQTRDLLAEVTVDLRTRPETAR